MVSFPNFFCDASGMGDAQLFWAFFSYGYVLFMASNLISDGSELLLLIPSIAGLVGSVVLPILGAVPDGMMVLFSGVDPDIEAAQEKVAVGVGALAGSTIMLLTIPWFLAISAGRVDVKEKDQMYKSNPKLTPGNFGLSTQGVLLKPAIKDNAKLMVLTSMIYFVILIPALQVDTMKPGVPVTGESRYEHKFALIGAFLCLAAFSLYMVLQYRATVNESADAHTFERKATATADNMQKFGLNFYIEEYRSQLPKTDAEKPLLGDVPIPSYIRSALRTIFDSYAKDHQVIDRGAFEDVFKDLHLAPSSAWVDKKFAETDEDGNGVVDFKEFILCFKHLVLDWNEDIHDMGIQRQRSSSRRPSITYVAPLQDNKANNNEEVEDDEEPEDIPEEWKDLDPPEQRKRILLRSGWMMGIGTLMVLVFSDPMVDVLSAIGSTTGVPAFYVSFVLAPMASNASELVAAYNYALKKTSKTITISMSTLEGAACMNNTFCLGIFFALIYVQGLAWRFSAETAVIVGVQVVMGFIAYTKEIQTLFTGCVIISLYPASLVVVVVLEAMGYD